MTTLLPGQLKAIKVGNDAGWVLGFYLERSGGIVGDGRLLVRVDDYEASVDATLPGGLEPGTYTFVIEGLSNKDYKAISQGPLSDTAGLAEVPGAAAAGLGGSSEPEKFAVVRLYLYWRDTNSSVGGYLGSLAGISDLTAKLDDDALEKVLVAELAIRSVSRRVGQRRYETVITAVERAYHRLASRRAEGSEDTYPTIGAHVEALCGSANVNVEPHGFDDGRVPPPDPEETGSAELTVRDKDRVLDTVARAAGIVEARAGKFGRGMALIRDGVLHFGPRDIPLDGEEKPLTLSSGLISSEKVKPVNRDPYALPDDDAPPPRDQFSLTLKGRPDIKPGDTVVFDPPPDEVPFKPLGVGQALAGAFAGPFLPSLGDEKMDNPTVLYVHSVRHKLSRTAGFATVVKGVVLDDPDKPYDARTSSASETDTEEPPDSSDSATDAAKGIRRLSEEVARARSLPELAEVRRCKTATSDEPIAQSPQTCHLWQGLDAPEGQAPGGGRNQARKLEHARTPPSPLPSVSYLTPFAWGKYGLFLPRYPGMRVAVAFRNGRQEDPLDIGALWRTPAPESEPGDWWLRLPADVPVTDRAKVPPAQDPSDHVGKASHDLIDADGNRVIEVGELTVRVGAGAMKDVGLFPRPGRATDQGSVTIEHTGGAQLVMKADGTAVIKAKNVEIEATDPANGTIRMTAKTIDISVADKVDIHG
jgi:hypothetical protein